MVRVCVCVSVRHSLWLSKELWPKHKPTTDAEVSAASLVGSDWLSICLLVRLFALALFIMRQIRVYHRTKANGTMGVALLPQRISCGNLMLFAPSNETIFAYINFIFENHLHTHKHAHTRTCSRAHAFKYTHTVWWPLKVWYNIGCAGAPFGQLFMHACVCVVRAVCDVYVTHMIDVCQRPIAPSAFIFMSPVSAGNQPTKQATTETTSTMKMLLIFLRFQSSQVDLHHCSSFHGCTARHESPPRYLSPLWSSRPSSSFHFPVSVSVSQPLSLLQSQCGSPNQVARIYIGQHLTKTVASLRETRARSRW